MNNGRRHMITKALETIRGAYTDLETARDEEQEYYDNMPDGIMESDKGDTAQEAIDALDEVIQSLDEALDRGEEATA